MIKNSVSILITNFNKDRFLEKSIISCIKQKYKEKEIIVFDDCSTDNSKEILRRKKKIKILYNKKKKFKSGPLNQISGIYEIFKKSKGDIIFLLDSDDYFKKNKMKSICKKFKENKNIQFIQDRPFVKKLKKNMILKKKHFITLFGQVFIPQAV